MEILVAVVLTLFVIAFLIYAGVQVGAVRASLFPIRIHQFVSPGIMGFRQDSFQVKTEDGVLIDGWVARGDDKTIFICAHGYLVNRCEWVPICQHLVPKGATMVFFDHRGHGRSGKAKVTLGKDEKLDVLAVCNWARTQWPKAKIVLMGSSMGGVACALAAEQVKPDAVILDAPFRNMREASDAWWLFLAGESAAKLMKPTSWIGPWMLGFRPETIKVDDALSVLDSNVPVLLYFGTDDPIVPVKSGEALKASVKGPVDAVWFEGSTHGAGRLNHPVQFREALDKFLDKHKLL
ncbi:MAG: alpha/beta fold hydrolase [Fimbriimonadaceae bacterium]|nr:MAG: alpha/beta fold hydrolase [Fimbriimonadaceae bacterium]